MTSLNPVNVFRTQVLPWVVYPSLISACIASHFLLHGIGMSLVWAAYAAVLFGAASVSFFEWLIPERREWTADQSTVANDLMFMLLVQMVLPKFLSFIAAVALLRGFEQIGWSGEMFWVHGWPVGVQVVFMILLADFFRYWFHVACHHYPFLWRFHAVHHSPKKLYWLNVGRFHPFEKGLQFLLDALPFILLGVGEEVLALYFVFYAVNGFFQHCNIRLRFGWLNYVVSSAELHRWHHSREISESNANFGNNLIVWDLLFKTWFLPKHRRVERLGLVNRDYPPDIASQIRTPFVEGIDQARVPFSSWRDIVLNFCFSLSMIWVRLRRYEPVKRAALNPARVQRDVLRRILATHRQTHFGRDHDLVPEMSLTDFRANVPVSDYERLKPYIERQERTGEPCLNPVQPVMFNVTSGTAGRPKYLPVLAETLRASARDQCLFAYVQYCAKPQGFRGKMLGIVSPAIEGHRPSGTSYGSASGWVYEGMPFITRAKYILPPEVFEIEDYSAKYYAILRLALLHRDITYMGSANPSTFLRLLDLLAEHRETLLDDIEYGTFQLIDKASAAQRKALRRGCRPDPKRAEEIRAAFEDETAPNLSSFWPHLRVITTWTGGSCGIAIASLKSRVAPEVSIIDLGYLASELRVTITIDTETNAGLPTFWVNFFEFVERNKWEQNQAEFLTLDQIQEGRAYYIFVTTPSGLFRYPMHDIVEVSGHFQNTPTLKFLQKGVGATNITGEKLYECQVLEAVRVVEGRLGFRSRFFQLLADEQTNCYLLYLEADSTVPSDVSAVSAELDQELGRLNIEYSAKRHSGRLREPKVFLLKSGALENYKSFCLARGGREAQFKTVALRYRRDFEFDLAAHTIAVTRH